MIAPSHKGLVAEDNIGFCHTNLEHVLPPPFPAVLPLSKCKSLSLSFFVSKTERQPSGCDWAVFIGSASGAPTAALSPQHQVGGGCGKASGDEDLLREEWGVTDAVPKRTSPQLSRALKVPRPVVSTPRSPSQKSPQAARGLGRDSFYSTTCKVENNPSVRRQADGTILIPMHIADRLSKNTDDMEILPQQNAQQSTKLCVARAPHST